jgi:hypothetical protein
MVYREQVLKNLGTFMEECFLLRGHNWYLRVDIIKLGELL